MNHEQKTLEYLLQLKQDGVLIDAYIIGVNEEFKSSTCIGRFLEGSVVKEKYITVYEENQTMKWNLLEVLEKTIQ
jgi:hypothetical protein